MFAEALSRPVTVRDKSGKIRRLSKRELMVEVMVNKAAAGDPKAFATVAQFADKFEVSSRLTVNHRELVDGALETLNRQIAALAREQEFTPQKDSQSTPAQPDPKMK